MRIKDVKIVPLDGIAIGSNPVSFQADWLMRFYDFDVSENTTAERPISTKATSILKNLLRS